jgi:hypothetical protein
MYMKEGCTQQYTDRALEVLGDLSSQLQQINLTLATSTERHWYDSQLASGVAAALIGALAAVVFTVTVEYLKGRKVQLKKQYQFFVEHPLRMILESCVNKAKINSYDSTTSFPNGDVVHTPEKNPVEKVLIEYKKQVKQDAVPWSRLRILLWQFERMLATISGDYISINQSTQLKKLSEQVTKLCESKIGESIYTV